MKLVWIAFATLLAIAGIAVWVNVSNPAWAYGFVAAAVGALIKALKPQLLKLFTRKTPEEEARDREAFRRGGLNDFRKHPGEH